MHGVAPRKASPLVAKLTPAKPAAPAMSAAMATMGARFPEGLVWDIPFDTTKAVEASIAEVWETLFIAVAAGMTVLRDDELRWRVGRTLESSALYRAASRVTEVG